MDDAIEEIKSGNVVGIIYMAGNYSESYEKRFHQGRNLDNESLDTSQIKVWLDMSSESTAS